MAWNPGELQIHVIHTGRGESLRQFVPPVMERLADRSCYPGERLVCPPFLPPERLAEARKAHAEWLRDVPPAALKGGHVVLTVPSGGRAVLLEYRSGTGETIFRRRFPPSNERTLP